MYVIFYKNSKYFQVFLLIWEKNSNVFSLQVSKPKCRIRFRVSKILAPSEPDPKDATLYAYTMLYIYIVWSDARLQNAEALL